MYGPKSRGVGQGAWRHPDSLTTFNLNHTWANNIHLGQCYLSVSLIHVASLYLLPEWSYHRSGLIFVLEVAEGNPRALRLTWHSLPAPGPSLPPYAGPLRRLE